MNNIGYNNRSVQYHQKWETLFLTSLDIHLKNLGLILERRGREDCLGNTVTPLSPRRLRNKLQNSNHKVWSVDMVGGLLREGKKLLNAKLSEILDTSL